MQRKLYSLRAEAWEHGKNDFEMLSKIEIYLKISI